LILADAFINKDCNYANIDNSQVKGNMTMNKIILVAFLGSMLALSSCGTSSSTSSIQEIVKYTITYETNGGTAVSSQTVEMGNPLAEPSSPTKDGYIFAGWYLNADASGTKISFPYSVTENKTLYAGWKEAREYYLQARDKTVGDESAGFEYASDLDFSVGYSAITYTANGKYKGKSQYHKGDNLSYYENINYSGVLFDDHSEYEYLKDRTLNHIKTQSTGEVTKFSSETVDGSYKYDSSSFAKALFTYSQTDIKKVSLSANGKYEIISSASFSTIATKILGNVNNKYVAMVLGELPETESTYHNYLTFDQDGYLDTYSYSFTVSVKGIEISMNYSLAFSSKNKAVTITAPEFDGFSINPASIQTELTKLKTGISNYKSLTETSYDYKVETGVSFSGSNEINSTVKGKALRKKVDDVCYFNDSFEIDSDYKNDDLYADSGIKDFNGAIGKLQNGQVYQVYNPLVGLKKYTEITDPGSTYDFFYLLDDAILKSDNINFVQSVTKDTEVVYSLGIIGNEIPVSLLNLVNNTTQLHPTLEKHVDVFGSFAASSIVNSESKLIFRFEGNALKSLAVDITGKFNTALTDSKNFTETKAADYSLKIDLTDMNLSGSYEIPTDKKDII